MDRALDYILNLEGEQQKILLCLHDLMMANVGITNKIRYKVPFYYNRSWICYFNPKKEGGMELCFLRGNELSNVQGLLDPKDRKQVAGITFHTEKEIPIKEVNEIIQEAIFLDETVPYAAKRKKR